MVLFFPVACFLLTNGIVEISVFMRKQIMLQKMKNMKAKVDFISPQNL